MGHAVVSPHALHRRDVKFTKLEARISVNSSKTKQKFKVHKTHIARAESHVLCPVYWLEKLFTIYPSVGADLLCSTQIYPQMSYSTLNKSLKNLIGASKIKGNFLDTFYS